MSRPPLEVADLIRTAGAAFLERNRQWLSWKHSQSAAGHCAVSHRRTRRSSRSVHPLRASRHLLQLAAATGTARSVRPLPGNAGSPHVGENFSRRATSMWSSHFLRSWHHWPCRTRKSSTICCSAPVRKPFSKSLAIRNTSARRSASSACCTPGIRSSDSTRMSIASFPPAACRSITRTGSNHAIAFFLPIKVLSRVFRGKFVAALKRAFRDGQLHFHGNLTPARPTEDLRRLATATVPKRLGGLLETTFRWPGVCAPVSGPLHPSRSHLQPSPGLVCRREGHFSLARFRSPQRTEVDDSIAR